jgi:hypothetical protein
MNTASGNITKRPGERLNLGFRFHSPSLNDGSENIVDVLITAPEGITVGTSQVDRCEVFAPVSGGTAGTDYTLVYTASTDQGQTYTRYYLVRVIE